MMKPALTIGGIPFYDAPSEVEGSPYWVDLWTDVNGYKIGLQVKPSTYKSANLSIYIWVKHVLQKKLDTKLLCVILEAKFLLLCQ